MTADETAKRATVSLLMKYQQRLDALIAILGKQQMTRIDVEEARRLYTELKEWFKIDRRELAQREARRQASHYEITFASPALHQASTRLQPATNTNPRNSNWMAAVYSAKIDIDHILNQLK